MAVAHDAAGIILPGRDVAARDFRIIAVIPSAVDSSYVVQALHAAVLHLSVHAHLRIRRPRVPLGGVIIEITAQSSRISGALHKNAVHKNISNAKIAVADDAAGVTAAGPDAAVVLPEGGALHPVVPGLSRPGPQGAHMGNHAGASAAESPHMVHRLIRVPVGGKHSDILQAHIIQGPLIVGDTADMVGILPVVDLHVLKVQIPRRPRIDPHDAALVAAVFVAVNQPDVLEMKILHGSADLIEPGPVGLHVSQGIVQVPNRGKSVGRLRGRRSRPLHQILRNRLLAPVLHVKGSVLITRRIQISLQPLDLQTRLDRHAAEVQIVHDQEVLILRACLKHGVLPASQIPAVLIDRTVSGRRRPVDMIVQRAHFLRHSIHKLQLDAGLIAAVGIDRPVAVHIPLGLQVSIGQGADLLLDPVFIRNRLPALFGIPDNLHIFYRNILIILPEGLFQFLPILLLQSVDGKTHDCRQLIGAVFGLPVIRTLAHLLHILRGSLRLKAHALHGKGNPGLLAGQQLLRPRPVQPGQKTAPDHAVVVAVAQVHRVPVIHLLLQLIGGQKAHGVVQLGSLLGVDLLAGVAVAAGQLSGISLKAAVDPPVAPDSRGKYLSHGQGLGDVGAVAHLAGDARRVSRAADDVHLAPGGSQDSLAVSRDTAALGKLGSDVPLYIDVGNQISAALGSHQSAAGLRRLSLGHIQVKAPDKTAFDLRVLTVSHQSAHPQACSLLTGGDFQIVHHAVCQIAALHISHQAAAVGIDAGVCSVHQNHVRQLRHVQRPAHQSQIGGRACMLDLQVLHRQVSDGTAVHIIEETGLPALQAEVLQAMSLSVQLALEARGCVGCLESGCRRCFFIVLKQIKVNISPQLIVLAQAADRLQPVFLGQLLIEAHGDIFIRHLRGLSVVIDEALHLIAVDKGVVRRQPDLHPVKRAVGILLVLAAAVLRRDLQPLHPDIGEGPRQTVGKGQLRQGIVLLRHAAVRQLIPLLVLLLDPAGLVADGIVDAACIQRYSLLGVKDGLIHLHPGIISLPHILHVEHALAVHRGRIEGDVLEHHIAGCSLHTPLHVRGIGLLRKIIIVDNPAAARADAGSRQGAVPGVLDGILHIILPEGLQLFPHAEAVAQHAARAAHQHAVAPEIVILPGLVIAAVLLYGYGPQRIHVLQHAAAVITAYRQSGIVVGEGLVTPEDTRGDIQGALAVHHPVAHAAVVIAADAAPVFSHVVGGIEGIVGGKVLYDAVVVIADAAAVPVAVGPGAQVHIHHKIPDRSVIVDHQTSGAVHGPLICGGVQIIVQDKVFDLSPGSYGMDDIAALPGSDGDGMSLKVHGAVEGIIPGSVNPRPFLRDLQIRHHNKVAKAVPHQLRQLLLVVNDLRGAVGVKF